ncbi:HTH-type transcriptional regulator MhqR [Pelagimonas phthalicica]|uniref:HTH-type transcriptional regulator MhqR n=1 Tax=Pelagimonas phthalicica TaxID=1037362 RepID=A0A238J9V2_9RHOB|nr:MarR family winged helix-turn-helix transcriptional regulator [Pelagimonas phthalicica]TDS93985.1 DNA-binding MarR family transcriptional regulator [Pelagimonas phthalicica]SMX27490.1 HTH-type transcriptional regulator MhqR [Pelagimonas phthalicica]
MQDSAGSVSKDRLRLWLRLLKSSRLIEAQLRERFRSEFASTLPRFDVMAALSQHPGGLKMSALSGVLRVSNGNVTGIIDRLTNEGLVERFSVPGDRRAALVRLTAAGETEFTDQAAQHEAWVNSLLGVISQGEVNALTEKMDSLVSALIEQEDRADG